MLPPCFPFKWQTVAFSFFWLPGRISFEPETNRYFKHFNVCAKRKMLAPLSTTGAGAVVSARARSKVTIVARPVAGLEWCPCPCPCSCPCTFPSRCQVGTVWHWVVCAPNGDPSRPSPPSLPLFGIAFNPPWQHVHLIFFCN